MFRYRWRKASEEPTLKTIELKRRKYEKRAAYVTGEKKRNEMLKDLALVSDNLKAGDLISAKSNFENVRHTYAMARFNNKVLRYKSTMGGAIAVLYLLALGAVFAAGRRYLTVDFEQTSGKVFLAAIGGGLGAVTLVMLGLIGMKVQTSAMIHRQAWFVLKPIAGCIMGLVTYCAMDLGAQTVAGHPVGRPSAVFLVAFLGGFFETFANNALLRASNIEKPSA